MSGDSDAFNPWCHDRSPLCIPDSGWNWLGLAVTGWYWLGLVGVGTDSKDAQVGSRSHALSREISGMGPWTLCPGFVGGPELFSSVPSSLKNELL